MMRGIAERQAWAQLTQCPTYSDTAPSGTAHPTEGATSP